MTSWTRKQFLQRSLAAGGLTLIASPAARLSAASGSANGDIRVACVGVRSKGAGHMRSYLKGLKGARLVAICDVDSEVLSERKTECDKAGVKVATFADYRKLLDDRSVDAVVLGTPNHQHALQTIWGLQAGKDVYVEKPLSHNIWEGRQAVEAARNAKNIVQAGTQNRSSLDIMDALAFVRSGQLGKIQWARGLCYKMRESIGLTTGPQPVPSTVNYDLWTGPADLTPPRRNGSPGPIHYDWHWFWNYGGGDITNQGIHQMDVARWFLDEPGLPASVMSFGGRFGYRDDAETPNTLVSVFNYAKAPLIFEVRGLPMKAGMKAMDHYRSARVGVIVQCENGYVMVAETGNASIFDNDNKRIQAFTRGGNGNHMANFLTAVRDRKVTHGLVEECHYSSALCHLGNLSYLVGKERANSAIAESIRNHAVTKEAFARTLDHLKANEVNVGTTKTVLGPLLTIDPKSEAFTGREAFVQAANRHALRKREGRGPFKIPVLQRDFASV
jgi:predicted dehydrogenase